MSVSEKPTNTRQGPFEVVQSDQPKGLQPASAHLVVSGDGNPVPACALPSSRCDEDALLRNIDCTNYQSCLNLAATLDWESFSCGGCSGEINQSLLWRAGQQARKDSIAKALCGSGMAFIKKLSPHSA